MSIVEWFVEGIKLRFGLEVSEDEVGSEAVTLYHDEIDKNYISSEELEKLPNPLVYETMMYIDNEGCTWVAGVATDIDNGSKLHVVWIKDGKKVV